MRSGLAIVAVIVLFVLFAGWLRAGLEGDAVLDRQPDRLITQLDNGLIVIAQRIDTAPVVSVQCWIKTGSIYEQEHNGAGLSHFLEHLVSGGTTTTRSEAESSRILGRMGAQTNAATSMDTVRYYINTTADHADTAIELMSDWMLNSVITQEEYERERQVIQREFDMGRGDPNRIFWMLTQQARYTTHPARHPIIGYLDEFLTVSRDEIYDFYKRMYVPNNMLFVVTGDIDLEAVTQRVGDLWADAPRGELPELSLPNEAPLTEPRRKTGHADVRLPRLRVAWPGTTLGGEHDYALDLLSTILGGGELSRLVQTIRDEQQLVTSIDAYNLSFPWGQGFFGVDAVTTPDKLELTRDAILAQVRRVRDQGVTADELDRAKAKTLASVVFAAQTAEGAASRTASDVIGKADPDYLSHYARAIQRLTPADLKAAANAVLDDEQLITVTLLPAEGEMPYLDRPADAGAGGNAQPVKLDNDHLAEQMRTNRRASEAHHAAELEPMRLVTLDNGLRVLIQRDTRLPIVAMQWYHLGGLLADDVGAEGVANAMGRMMLKGAGGRTADQIARELESIGATLNTNCGNNTWYVASQCLSAHWQDVLAIMADVVVRPDFPADQWALMQPRLVAAIDSSRDRWSSELMQVFDERYFAGHPWAQPVLGRRDVVAELTVDDLERYHRRRIAGPNGVLAIVGDVDPKVVERTVTEWFEALPASAERPFEAGQPPAAPTGIVQVQTAKPLCAVAIGLGPGLARDDPDYPAVEVMTKLVSNFPSGWLHKALRGEGPGLVYAAWAFNRTGVVPGAWMMAFNTQPATAPEAIRRSLAITQRLRNDPADADELQRAKAAVRVGESLAGQSNAQRASRAALDELYGVGFENTDRMLEQVEQVTAQRIGEVAQKYLGEPLIVILTNQPVDESAIEAE